MINENITPLFDAIVGSQAHGLARPDSDTDYRSVYAVPTAVLLSMHSDSVKKAWQNVDKDGDDKGGYEVVRWLELMEKCSPSALELAYAPSTVYHRGQGLQEIARTLITRKPLINAMIGYAMNSWRKIDDRPGKWKAGMLRTLYMARHIATYGPSSDRITLDVSKWTPYEYEAVLMARDNILSEGDVWNMAKVLRDELDREDWALLPEKLTDETLEHVNDWLIRLRLDLLKEQYSWEK